VRVYQPKFKATKHTNRDMTDENKTGQRALDEKSMSWKEDVNKKKGQKHEVIIAFNLDKQISKDGVITLSNCNQHISKQQSQHSALIESKSAKLVGGSFMRWPCFFSLSLFFL
jgi:hypothetical protein